MRVGRRGGLLLTAHSAQAVAVNEGLIAAIAAHIDDQRERALLASVCQAWRRALRLAWPSCRLRASKCRWLRGPDAPIRLRSLDLLTPGARLEAGKGLPPPHLLAHGSAWSQELLGALLSLCTRGALTPAVPADFYSMSALVHLQRLVVQPPLQLVSHAGLQVLLA